MSPKSLAKKQIKESHLHAAKITPKILKSKATEVVSSGQKCSTVGAHFFCAVPFFALFLYFSTKNDGVWDLFQINIINNIAVW